MKLDRMVLENFRQYFGRQRLTFARDQQRAVTVINGVNGAGKTSLFLAINWCLYGRNVDSIKVVDNVGELVSKEAINRAREGERVCASVELAFLHDGERYLVKRSTVGIKQGNGALAVTNPDEFVMLRTRGDGQTERIGNPLGTMNAILPVNVREYFLFDGEKIDDFAKPEAAAQVKQAIYLVLKLEILERARRHLEAVAADYRKDLKRLSSAELRILIEQDEQLRADRDKAEQRKVEVGAEVESARRKIAELDERLRQLQNSKALQMQREGIEADLARRRTELSAAIEQLRDLAVTGFPIIAQGAIDRTLGVLDAKRARGEVPSNIREQFIDDLINRRVCICGREFSEGSAEHQCLLGMKKRSLPGSLEDDVLDTSAALRSFAERIARHRVDVASATNRRAELVELIKRMEAELDDITRQLKGSPLEEIGRLERQRQTFLADIDSLNIELGTLGERIETLSKEIARLEKEIAKARKNANREVLLGTKLELAQQAADAIADMYQVFADDMRGRIEAKTREIFKQLVWKESHFRDVKLGADYNLEVIDRYGMPARPELSAGERQVLSLSFITAMSRISEEEAPLVMDTPFGRLSSQPRMNIAKHLPDLAEQLVLFVTDEELRGEARETLERRVGAEYRLDFNEATSCTEIVEVR